MKPEVDCIYFRPVSKTHRGRWRCEELDNPGTCECKTPLPKDESSVSLHPVIEQFA